MKKYITKTLILFKLLAQKDGLITIERKNIKLRNRHKLLDEWKR